MKPGDIIAQKYKVRMELGKGGTSTVYLTENIIMGTYWTIKHMYKGSEVVISAYSECEMLKKINYPTLPRIFDFIEEENDIYIVMDYAEGRTLKEIIEFSQQVSQKDIISWFTELANTLKYLHDLDTGAIIYRDMKPANIIVMKDNRIRLIDFGSARDYKAGNGEDTVYIGTRGYAAPEQYGIGQSDKRTDIYSLGVTMFELITGISPLVSINIRREIEAYLESCEDGLIKIIDKCTRDNNADRYEDTYALLEDLSRYQNGAIETKENNRGKVLGGSFLLNKIMGKRKYTPIAFKKQILVVLENLEFSCELAYAIALMSETRVALVDMDTFGLSIESYLNIKAIGNFIEELREKGFERIGRYKYDTFQKKELFVFGSVADHTDSLYKSKIRVRGEIFEEKGVSKAIVDVIYNSFDFTIINVSGQIDDKARKSFFAGCDCIVVPMQADIMDIRKRSLIMDYVYANEKLRVKAKYVLWQYQKDIHIPYTYIKDLIGKEKLAGAIPFHRLRQEYRKYGKYKPEKLVNIHSNEYKKIMKELNVYSYAYINYTMPMAPITTVSGFQDKRNYE